MAKNNRGGRRAAAAAAQATQDTAQQAPVTPAAAPNTPPPTNLNAYKAFSDSDAAALRQKMDSFYDSDATDAIKLYISNSNPNGDGYSHSQNLNYKLANNMPLSATEQFINDNIVNAMHPIGQNIQLFRYSHDDTLKTLGIKDYTKMTEAQLQKQLVGTQFKTTSYSSTSYDQSKNPFRPGATYGGGKEVVWNIKAAGSTKMVFGAKSQAEIVLDKNTNVQIVGVRYDNSYATPRSSSGQKRRIIIDAIAS